MEPVGHPTARTPSHPELVSEKTEQEEPREVEKMCVSPYIRKMINCSWLNQPQDESHRKLDMKLIVPEALKVVLVDDWEAVTKNNQVSESSFIPLISVRMDILWYSSWHSLGNPQW
jgi:MRG